MRQACLRSPAGAALLVSLLNCMSLSSVGTAACFHGLQLRWDTAAREAYVGHICAAAASDQASSNQWLCWDSGVYNPYMPSECLASLTAEGAKTPR